MTESGVNPCPIPEGPETEPGPDPEPDATGDRPSAGEVPAPSSDMGYGHSRSAVAQLIHLGRVSSH